MPQTQVEAVVVPTPTTPQLSEHVQVSLRVAVVLPLFIQKDMDALEDRMLAAGMARLIGGRAKFAKLTLGDTFELGSDSPLMFLPHWQHLSQGRRRCGVDAEHLRPLWLNAGPREAPWMVGMLNELDAPKQPAVCREDEVTKRFDEAPLSVNPTQLENMVEPARSLGRCGPEVLEH